MFGIDATILGFIVMAMLGAGALGYALLYDRLTTEANQAKRMKNIRERDQAKVSKASQRIQDAAKRRKTVQDSLKDLEEKQRAKHDKKVTLKKLLQQAGLNITVQQFYFLSVVFAILVALALLITGASMLVVTGGFFIALFGLPRWVVGFIRKRRFKAFLEEFPNSVDVIVRGVKAGLPLNDCLGIIARESKEPVASEFSKVVESQQMGMTMGEAIQKLYTNIPLPEVNFFTIVISIQQQAGGNLSEALGNLSNVLRDRKKLQGKIKAMSSEAKASAGIIGSLPFVVMLLVYLTTPDYILLLFTDSTGNLILLGAAVWMSVGVMVMRTMINFDF